VRYLTWFTQEHFFKQRAVLIGTRSIKKSNQIQEALVAENIPSNVLNAKHTAREAEIISQAGQPQTVTVATNMAGRGTDIKLAEKVKEKGGLWVIGTERHNARRIDNQLIGRAGRQGDPGESQFLISADDELINPHFRERYIKTLKKHQSWHQGTESKRLEQILKKAQKRMENLFFDQRILNFEFDKVLEAQRASFYRQRERVLQDSDLRKETLGLLKIEVMRLSLEKTFLKTKTLSQEQVQQIFNQAQKIVNNQWANFNLKSNKKRVTIMEITKALKEAIERYYNDFENYYTSPKTREMEKITTLKVLDLMWVNHLKVVERLQEAALIDSLSKSDFFGEYEIKMNRAYRQMLLAMPRVLCRTILGTINQLWKH
jgi:preprotein translocase subunit SecA